MKPGVTSTHATIQASTNGSPATRGSTRLTNGTAIVSAAMGLAAMSTRSAAAREGGAGRIAAHYAML